MMTGQKQKQQPKKKTPVTIPSQFSQGLTQNRTRSFKINIK